MAITLGLEEERRGMISARAGSSTSMLTARDEERREGGEERKGADPTTRAGLPGPEAAAAFGRNIGEEKGAPPTRSPGRDEFQPTPLSEYKSYDDMDLPESLLRGIYGYGWDAPTPIQRRGVIPVMSGRDIVAQAQSGTGKTGTFCIGALGRVAPGDPATQLAILAPTRELADQIYKVAVALSTHMGITLHVFVGGSSVRDDIAVLRQGVQVVCGTPGRVLDMISRGHLKTDRVRTIVLDEADQMLAKGFTDQVYEIFHFMPPDVQVCLFSATMPVECLKLSSNFMRKPVRILVKNNQVTLDGIKQF